MNLLLFSILILLVLCFFLKRHAPQLSRGLGLVGALAGLAFGVFALLRPSEAESRADSIETVGGAKMGELVAARVPAGGTVLVLMQPGGNEAALKLCDARFEGLQERLPGYQLLRAGFAREDRNPGADFISIDPSRVWTGVREYCEERGSVDAVVSLLPFVDGLQADRLAGLPPIYAYVAGREDLNGLLRDGLMHGAIGYRDYFESSRELEGKPSPEDFFHAQYKVVTPSS